MNSFLSKLASGTETLERLAANLRTLSPEEVRCVVAGHAEVLPQTALNSKTDVDRKIQVDRVYRK